MQWLLVLGIVLVGVLLLVGLFVRSLPEIKKERKYERTRSMYLTALDAVETKDLNEVQQVLDSIPENMIEPFMMAVINFSSSDYEIKLFEMSHAKFGLFTSELKDQASNRLNLLVEMDAYKEAHVLAKCLGYLVDETRADLMDAVRNSVDSSKLELILEELKEVRFRIIHGHAIAEAYLESFKLKRQDLLLVIHGYLSVFEYVSDFLVNQVVRIAAAEAQDAELTMELLETFANEFGDEEVQSSLQECIWTNVPFASFDCLRALLTYLDEASIRSIVYHLESKKMLEEGLLSPNRHKFGNSVLILAAFYEKTGLEMPVKLRDLVDGLGNPEAVPIKLSKSTISSLFPLDHSAA